jgi:6-phosphogluconolactonase
MGDDGHTASLFQVKPYCKNDKWVSAYYLESQSMFRITLTAPIINRAKEIVVITFERIRRVKRGFAWRLIPKNPTQLIKPLDGKLLFLTDQAYKYER